MLIRGENLLFQRPGGFELHVPDISVSAGEAVAILGPSGSGKSTLLDLIGGVLRPSSGMLEAFGQDTGRLSLGALDQLRGDCIGVIFQEHNLLPFASVFQNVALGVQFSKARRARLKSGSLATEIAALLTEMDLDAETMMHRPAHTLSVGQRQRVAAARALADQPSAPPRPQPLRRPLQSSSAGACALSAAASGAPPEQA